MTPAARHLALPPLPFARPMIVRAIGFWIGVRLFLALGGGPLPFGLSGENTIGAGAVVVVVIVTIVAWLEARRRHELLFLANLGVRPTVVAALAGGVTIALELLAQLGG